MKYDHVVREVIHLELFDGLYHVYRFRDQRRGYIYIVCFQLKVLLIMTQLKHILCVARQKELTRNSRIQTTNPANVPTMESYEKDGKVCLELLRTMK